VALLIETSNRYGRELLYGIRAYLREHFSWAIHLTEQGRGNVPPRWLRGWKGDGIIARVETAEIAKAVRATGLPVVNVSATRLAAEFVSVVTDSAAATRLAAEHLLDRGLQHFGFCGDARFDWSQTHQHNFVEHLRSAGFACSEFPTTRAAAENREQERKLLARWVRGLPKPAGVMACYDIRGQQLLDACRQARIPVPDQIAVIGLHNDELLCDLCEPPLSSVIPNARGAGYQAAALLDQMMQGRGVEAGVRTVPPLGVATRQSTDVVAVGDEQIAAAIRFIREHACDGITVEDVVRTAALSRTALERGFRKHLHRTPHEQILQTRLTRVKQMLIETDLPLRVISQRTGFAHPEYLSVAFKRQTGVSPTDFRRTSQL
jgi:LacI family transcriptional regulator